MMTPPLSSPLLGVGLQAADPWPSTAGHEQQQQQQQRQCEDGHRRKSMERGVKQKLQQQWQQSFLMWRTAEWHFNTVDRTGGYRPSHCDEPPPSPPSVQFLKVSSAPPLKASKPLKATMKTHKHTCVATLPPHYQAHSTVQLQSATTPNPPYPFPACPADCQCSQTCRAAATPTPNILAAVMQ